MLENSNTNAWIMYLDDIYYGNIRFAKNGQCDYVWYDSKNETCAFMACNFQYHIPIRSDQFRLLTNEEIQECQSKIKIIKLK